MKLHGCKGCGSAAIEALLELAGAAYERPIFDWDDKAAWDRLRTINPLAQVPTLVTDDGTVMTESAAIALWLADRHPDAALLPQAEAARASAYRWIVSLATNTYATIIVGDFPDRWVDGEAAQTSLKAHALERLKAGWTQFEASVAPSPYLAGDAIGALDVYAAMISRWRPGRAWIVEHCPKIAASLAKTEAHPVVASVWGRNFA